MTRKEIKLKITHIIYNIIPKTTEEAYIDWDDAEEAAEEIMKFWDNGFVYEIKDEK